MPTPLCQGLTCWAAPGKLLGSLGGCLEACWPLQAAFPIPVLHPQLPMASGSWAVSCLGFQAPRRAQLPPTLCHGPHKLMCTSGVTHSPWGSPNGSFLKISLLGKIHISHSSFEFGMSRKWETGIFLKMVILMLSCRAPVLSEELKCFYRDLRRAVAVARTLLPPLLFFCCLLVTGCHIDGKHLWLVHPTFYYGQRVYHIFLYVERTSELWLWCFLTLHKQPRSSRIGHCHFAAHCEKRLP